MGRGSRSLSLGVSLALACVGPGPASVAPTPNPGAGASAAANGVPATEPVGGFDLTLERSSGSPPFTQNRLEISGAGEVVSRERCDGTVPECPLRIPNTPVPGPTAFTCQEPKQPVLRARAQADALAKLAAIVTGDGFAALKDAYVVPTHDVGAFTLRVRTARGEKMIKYSPWTEFEKEPVGKQVDEALAALLASLAEIRQECEDRPAGG